MTFYNEEISVERKCQTGLLVSGTRAGGKKPEERYKTWQGDQTSL
jgi:hypothetical protein